MLLRRALILGFQRVHKLLYGVFHHRVLGFARLLALFELSCHGEHSRIKLLVRVNIVRSEIVELRADLRCLRLIFFNFFIDFREEGRNCCLDFVHFCLEICYEFVSFGLDVGGARLVVFLKLKGLLLQIPRHSVKLGIHHVTDVVFEFLKLLRQQRVGLPKFFLHIPHFIKSFSVIFLNKFIDDVDLLVNLFVKEVVIRDHFFMLFVVDGE